LLEDRWILSRFNRVTAEVNDALATYRFHEAANRIYDFFWGEFCDWYLELIKPRLNFEEGADKTAAHGRLREPGESVRRLVAPAASRDAVYHRRNLAGDLRRPASAQVDCAGCISAVDEKQFDLAAETEMAILQDLIVSVRNLRAELKVEPKVKVPIEIFAHEPAFAR
jgi:valyl-tRNA synthetase